MSEDREMNPTGSQIRYGGRYSIGHANGRFRAKRLVALALLFLLALVFFAGCGGGTRGAGPIIKSGSQIARGGDDVPTTGIPEPVLRPSHLPNLKSHRVIVSEMATAETEAQARQTFADLRAGDLYNRLLAEALCTGMGGLAEQDEYVYASQGAWREFLYDYPENYAESVIQSSSLGYLRQEWIGRVDGTMTTWDLAQVHGGVAVRYFNACVVR